MGRAGVVVAQMGGPAGPEDVSPFIRAIFSDPAMVPLPGGPLVRRAVARAVSLARARSVRARYRQIGGGSPMRDTTERQAGMLREELRRRGRDVEVAVAMRYAAPDTADATERLLSAGADRLIMMPLYPQFSLATTGSSERELRRVLAERAPGVDLEVIRTWHDHPSYLDAVAATVEERLLELPLAAGVETVLLFSAHAIPLDLVERGDPYPSELEATVDAVVERVRSAGYPTVEARLAYQSRSGPARWIGPDSFDVVRELPAQRRVAVVVVPISFVSDHLETLWEIDLELRTAAAEAGVERFARVPVLGTRSEVGPVLADVVEDHL